MFVFAPRIGLPKLFHEYNYNIPYNTIIIAVLIQNNTNIITNVNLFMR